MNLSKMVEFSYKFYDFCCRTPLGVRGLKYHSSHDLQLVEPVAPRLGCVD